MLVTTDLAARGLDNLDVAHVVQFDFAKSATDYVHRCGRTARAGRSGTVTSFVTKSDMGLVNALKTAQRQGGDMVVAGDAHQRRARTVSALAAAPAASFPECRGLAAETGEKPAARNQRRRVKTRRKTRRS